MILLLCIISLCLWIYNMGKARPGIHFVKLAVFSLCAFFASYTVVGAAFFWADRFSFTGVLLVCVTLQAGLAAILIWRGEARMNGGIARTDGGIARTDGGIARTDGVGSGAESARGDGRGEAHIFGLRVSFDMRRYWIPIVIALLALPFTWNKFELYSMGQDQGTYQVKALALMEYDTHNYMEMEEFTRLETPEERQKYLDFVYGQNNLYLPRVIEETDEDASHFDRIVGTIHGLPTYSALLALWGKLFGYENMIGVQTPLYLCLIFLAYFIAENMGLRKGTAFWLTLLTAFSPIVVWGSKSSLTEISLAAAFAVFLYFLTGKRQDAWMAWTPLAAFACLHISIYVFMPVLIVILFFLYFMQRERGWLVSVLGTLAGYLLSAFWAFDIAPYYSYGNYSVLWKLSRRLINENNIHAVIVLLCTVLGAGAVFLMTERGERFAGWMAEKAAGGFERGCVWLIRLALAGSAVFFIYKGVLTAEYVRYCEYLQISTYVYMTGLLVIPFIYLYLLWRPERVLRDQTASVLTLLFFYCVIAYSSFMRLDVQFYYYYARYVTIFLIPVFLLAGWLLETADRKGKLSFGLFAAAFLSFLPYDAGLIYQKDHTRCEWEVLGDICEDITPQDAFIAGPDEQQIVFIFPVKLLTGCDVYYADENLRGQIGKLALQYRNIYYLDYDGALEEKMAEDTAWQDGTLSVRQVYTNWNHLSYLDYFNITNPLTPIPLQYVEYRLKLSLHEISLNG